ncbi:hypothetical protein QF027_002881 [Streptomyces canus]|nr:hypothetical protein [Streptomyces canus]
MANSHSEEIFPPYRGSHVSFRSAASAVIRSAWAWAAWWRQSLT